MRKAYLVSPHMDKGYTLMIFHNLSSDHNIVGKVLTLNDKMRAHVLLLSELPMRFILSSGLMIKS